MGREFVPGGCGAEFDTPFNNIYREGAGQNVQTGSRLDAIDMVSKQHHCFGDW